MSRAQLKASLALWRRRHAYRQRKLDIAHAKNDAASIAKWHKYLVASGAKIRHRLDQLADGDVAAPVKKVYTSAWGWHPAVHDGVDLMCPNDATVYALCDAKVIDVRASGWWGNGAKPSAGHPVSDGDGIIQLECLTDAGPFRKGLHFGYGHAEHATVKVGQVVKAGQAIGRAGFANGSHVHFMCNSGNTLKGIGDRDPRPYIDYATKEAA